MLKKLYCMACRRWRRSGLTFSASAHLRAMHGRPWARNRIDGAWLFLFGIHGHCQTTYQRETRDNDERTTP